jgi:5-formyltetrahydrofolate cyclo-ligase
VGAGAGKRRLFPSAPGARELIQGVPIVRLPALGQALPVIEKQAIRERIWRRIDTDPDVGRPPGAEGRIPNFAGAEAAAERLARLEEWQAARVIKSNPDTPQLPVRAAAIDAGKLLYMAVPKLSAEAPFFALTKSTLQLAPREAATIDGARAAGVLTALELVEPVDLIVCGSVAVNAQGVRIGKGGGYADLEFALLAELGLVSDQTLIATTVHDVQVLDDALPETAHDFRVDVIATPTRTIHCARAARPQGILWNDLDAQKIAAIPLLARLEAGRSPTSFQ